MLLAQNTVFSWKDSQKRKTHRTWLNIICRFNFVQKYSFYFPIEKEQIQFTKSCYCSHSVLSFLIKNTNKHVFSQKVCRYTYVRDYFFSDLLETLNMNFDFPKLKDSNVLGGTKSILNCSFLYYQLQFWTVGASRYCVLLITSASSLR